MLNRKFMTENARITDAYAQMYARRGVNESSNDGNGNLLRSLRGQLPIDGTGSPRTGSKLGVRKVLPFEKRDSRNCCGHSVPMKSTFGYGKVKTGPVDTRKIEHVVPSSTGSKLGVCKVLPFEKRDDRPTSIGRISNVRNVSVVKGVRESIDDFEDIEDTETISCEGCDKRDEVLDLVLSTFEQIYDNLSDDDKETVDEVKVEIESVLNPENDDEDEDEDDVDSDFEDEEEDIDESVVNEAGASAVARSAAKGVAKGAARGTAKGVGKSGVKKVAKGTARTGVKNTSADGIKLSYKELEAGQAKFNKQWKDLTKKIYSQNPMKGEKYAQRAALKQLIPKWKNRHPSLDKWLKSLAAAAIAGGVSYGVSSFIGGEDNKKTGMPDPVITNSKERVEIKDEDPALKAAENRRKRINSGAKDEVEIYRTDEKGVPLSPEMQAKMREELNDRYEYQKWKARRGSASQGGGDGRGVIDQIADVPGRIIGGIAKGGEALLSAPSKIIKNTVQNIRASGNSPDEEIANEENRLKMLRNHAGEMMKMRREDEQARLEAEQKRREQAEKLQQRQTAAPSETQTHTVKDDQGGDNKVVQTSDSVTVTGPNWKEKPNGTEETK